ncbi:hypothetical protein L873DRAFT_1829033 [Choiromyces venosus 120613-1]|uniref:Allergen n=1 Tax=Choiromyces venosus 120613-1 TaxID=1336337 RepID=A0A3N4JGB6_9PEZI|nr:hypothetical protein L873DRAFT_1829033 [Choiromyces venosus 120613-1]
MQAAKEAVKEFIHRDQKHDTEVRETFNPAITKERIIQKEIEESTTAIDRERHQDHYQTRIQPIEDHTVLPEQHKHNILPVEHRERRNFDDAESHMFKSTREALPVERTQVEGTTVASEHAHHHVYENVQPVIEREVVQPAVIHTTRQIHEKIVHEPSFHPPTVQPKMTLDEYKRAGGVLDGKKETRDWFEEMCSGMMIALVIKGSS